MRFIVSLALAALFQLCVFFNMAQAQDWPVRPIKLVVPFAAGGNTDSIARLVSERLTHSLGQPVVVENRLGAGGGIAADSVAKAVPDGYTLLMAAMPVMAILPVISKTNYDPIRDFQPISNIGSNPFVMGVHRSIPANTVQEFVSYVKKNPGKFNFASGGSGSVSHLTPALFLKRAELDMTHIAYKGGAPAVADLLSGNVQMYFGNLSELQPHVGGGLIKIIGVSSERRALLLPLVPTIAESGYPGFKTVTWNGLMAPAGTPQSAINKLSEAIKDMMSSDATRQRLLALGVDPIGNSSKEFAETVKSDIVIWSEAAKAANLKME
jgi:tripartite-type tricarboxylate transporter receptor subunit TctC